AYFDMLTREIDMTFDQSSSHFVVYKKDGMIPISTIRVVPKEKIRLPVEFGILPDSSFYEVKDKDSSEISHTANLTTDKAKEKGVSFRTFAESLKMIFSAAIRYNISNKIGSVVLTYDENDIKLENLYLKLGFKMSDASVGYPGYPKRYTVMSMNIAESFENAIKSDNKTQAAIISGIMNDPLKTFMLVHDAMFAAVPSYKKMYEEIVSEIENRDSGLERKLVVDMPVMTGNLSKMLAEKYDITGVELSKDALILAEDKAKEANPDVKYLKIEANVVEGVPIESGSADYVTCVNLLYALKEPEKALSEIYRILKPGGYAVITNFNENVLLPEDEFMKRINENFSPEESKDVKFWKDSNDIVNISSDIIRESYFSKEALCSKIKEAGFEVETIRETFLGNSYLAVARKN
ncbi:MAG: class I SAM-dependent methyltransferase, partial [Candidatus Woesearchaeota archaeon]|nr:class I SAM-dependent methyltransferase [Candidatus Woesearchaeota archaeon]